MTTIHAYTATSKENSYVAFINVSKNPIAGEPENVVTVRSDCDHPVQQAHIKMTDAQLEEMALNILRHIHRNKS